MKPSNSKRMGMPAILAVCVLLSLSCGLTQRAGEATQPPLAEATQPPAVEPIQPPTPTAAPPQIAGLDTLASYRLQINWLIQSADGSRSTEASTSEERVRGENPAMHVVAVVPNLGEPGAVITAETIYLGDTAYARQTDGSWLPMQMQGWEQMGGDFWSVADVQDWTPAGEETVSGVHCQHHTFRLEVPPEGDRTLPLRIEGGLWVADQPDLPPVIVRQWVRWEGEGSPVPFAGAPTAGEILITTMDAQLSDLNAPITIEVPVTPTPSPLPPAQTSPPTPTLVPLPTAVAPPTAVPPPAATPTPVPGLLFVEQPSYTGDCTQRPAGSLCLAFDDGYVWLVYDSGISAWSDGEPWQGMQVRIAHGAKADYHHVMGTLLVKVVPK